MLLSEYFTWATFWFYEEQRQHKRKVSLKIHCKNEKWQQASMTVGALLKSLLCNKWVLMIWSQIRILVKATIVGKYVHVTSSSLPEHYSYWYYAKLQKQDF